MTYPIGELRNDVRIYFRHDYSNFILLAGQKILTADPGRELQEIQLSLPINVP